MLFLTYLIVMSYKFFSVLAPVLQVSASEVAKRYGEGETNGQ